MRRRAWFKKVNPIKIVKNTLELRGALRSIYGHGTNIRSISKKNTKEGTKLYIYFIPQFLVSHEKAIEEFKRLYDEGYIEIRSKGQGQKRFSMIVQ